MEDYAGNSKKDKEAKASPVEPDRPKVEKIVTGEVILPKKTLSQKFKDTFFDGDFYKGLFHSIYREKVVPNTKNVLFDIGYELWKGAVFRSSDPRQVLDPRNIVQRFNYSGGVNRMGGFPPTMSSPPTQLGLNPAAPRQASMVPGRAYIYQTRREAEDILRAMTDIIDSPYKVVSLLELHEMSGLPIGPVDSKWGWFALGNARITQVPEGHLLELPQPEAL